MANHHISQFFSLPSNAELDFFDANLVFDSPVFIDPFLLKNSPIEEERRLFDRFGDYFRYAYDRSLLVGLQGYTRTDLKKILTVHEPKNINMGYTYGSNDGHGPSLAEKLFGFFIDTTARRFVRDRAAFPEQKYNPVSLQVFTKGIGPDGISDITANLIMDYLVKYTQEQARAWGIPLKSRMALNADGFDFDEMKWRGGGYYELPENPVRPGEPLVFVPHRLIRGLEEIHDNTTGKVLSILKSDRELSTRFAELLTKRADEVSIEDIQAVFKQDSSIHKRYLSVLEQERNKPYDFKEDPLNILADKNYDDYFKDKRLPPVRSCVELNAVVTLLVEEFRKEYALRDGWKDAWKGSSSSLRPQTEPVIGRKFRAMGFAIFGLYEDVTFVPEPGTGNGVLDFQVVYKECIIAIELKLLKSSSTKGEKKLPAYMHGIQVQLPHYVELINAKYAYYITGLHYDGKKDPKYDHRSRMQEVSAARQDAEKAIRDKLPNFKNLYFVNVDMTQRESASKM